MAEGRKKIETVAEGVCTASLKGTCTRDQCPKLHLPPTARYYDAHCHLDRIYKHYHIRMEDFDLPQQFAGTITNFIDPELYRYIPDLLKHPKVYGTIGLHPQHAEKFKGVRLQQIKSSLRYPKIVAIGETGLDAKHLSHTQEHNQRRAYQFQLDLVRETCKALVLHCRDKNDDMLAMAKDSLSRDQRIHLHCFTGNITQARQWTDTFPNLKIGLTNLVSAKNAKEIREVAQELPLDKLILETDAPYMVPRNVGKSYRLQFSHPGLSLNVASVIAGLKNIPIVEVMEKTSENVEATYWLLPPAEMPIEDSENDSEDSSGGHVVDYLEENSGGHVVDYFED